MSSLKTYVDLLIKFLNKFYYKYKITIKYYYFTSTLYVKAY